ncbi:aconitate hydratase AcnA [soil metagenome]
MTAIGQDTLKARATLTAGGKSYDYFALATAAEAYGDISRLPFSMKVLLENMLRFEDGVTVTTDDVKAIIDWQKNPVAPDREIQYRPARVLMQDFTGVPCVVDLAAMRDAITKLGGDAAKINPLVPVHLVIDHSVMVDEFGTPKAFADNVDLEYQRNMERYEFLKWGSKALDNFSVVPPGTGICHQVNLEYIGQAVWSSKGTDGAMMAYPDTLVGTDSHTTMVNGLGVLGWGVGGIEAEAAMLGQPVSMLIPEVVGFKLTDALKEGITATDLVLTVTQMLRAKGVVGRFVEFYGPGLAAMTLADRATIANMAPEYGATMGFFPVDDQTLSYLRLTGRDPKLVDLVERYCKEQGLWRQKNVDPIFNEVLELDLATVMPSVAGPRRPQDRIELRGVKQNFRSNLVDVFKKEAGESATPRLDRWSAEAPVGAAHSSATDLTREDGDEDAREAATTEHLKGQKSSAVAVMDDKWMKLTHGDVVIAAITSCTNTSNPSVMVAAGLVAKKAVERGLKVPPYVKTSLSPGSRVVTEYFEKAGLQEYLDALGFNTTGYGCMTCIGNSGPLPEAIANAIDQADLVAASVPSGNRNFEGRINPHVKANYLASPPLVVAYALAGTMDINIMDEAIAKNDKGEKVFLKDIWPTQQEVQDVIASSLEPEMFRKQYANVGQKNEQWNAIPVRGGELYDFDPSSTYIQDPPFFANLAPTPSPIAPIRGARVLAMVGDSVTTDHISPAGSIKKDSPAGKYLMENGVSALDFNSFGSRRGNDRVMTRGTFANIRLRNLLAPGTEGGVTRYLGKPGEFREEILPIFDASMRYQAEKVPLVVLAGKDYGMGSSRDWAAKGVFLLGVKAVIAESFERIHRSNLVGMGVLPLVYKKGTSRSSLGLTGIGTFDISVDDQLKPGQDVKVRVTNREGDPVEFTTTCRIDTPVELEYYRNGGILQTVLRQLLKGGR